MSKHIISVSELQEFFHKFQIASSVTTEGYKSLTGVANLHENTITYEVVTRKDDTEIVKYSDDINEAVEIYNSL